MKIKIKGKVIIVVVIVVITIIIIIIVLSMLQEEKCNLWCFLSVNTVSWSNGYFGKTHPLQQ